MCRVESRLLPPSRSNATCHKGYGMKRYRDVELISMFRPLLEAGVQHHAQVLLNDGYTFCGRVLSAHLEVHSRQLILPTTETPLVHDGTITL